MPERIQRKRTRGWRMPEGAVYVGRPTVYGNPFQFHERMGGLVRYRPTVPDEFEFEGRISANGMRHDYFDADGSRTTYYVRWATRAEIVELFRRTLFEPDRGMVGAWPSRRGHFAKVTPEQIRAELFGKNLACWCPLDQPCHADVLLEIANAPEPDAPVISSARVFLRPVQDPVADEREERLRDRAADAADREERDGSGGVA